MVKVPSLYIDITACTSTFAHVLKGSKFFNLQFSEIRLVLSKILQIVFPESRMYVGLHLYVYWLSIALTLCHGIGIIVLSSYIEISI